MRKQNLRLMTFLLLAGSLLGLSSQPVFAKAGERPSTVKSVNIPGTDHFVPFGLTIRVGDTVQWTNQDTDDHTIVSDDAFTSSAFRGVNKLIPGTDSNGGKPGVVKIKFRKPGTFIYYCRFHAMLNSDNQPIAPGPKGGIQDGKGNFGTPMMGVITVMDRDDL